MASNVFGELVLAARHAITNRTGILAIHDCRCCRLGICLHATQIYAICRLFCALRATIVVIVNCVIIKAGVVVGATMLLAHCIPLTQILATYHIFVIVVRATLPMLVVGNVFFIDIIVVLVLVVIVVGAASQVVMIADMLVVEFGGAGVALGGYRGGVVGVISGVIGAGRAAAAGRGLGADVHRFDRGI